MCCQLSAFPHGKSCLPSATTGCPGIPKPGNPRRESVPKHVVDAYWSFRSPYSYIALPRMRALREEMNIDWNFKIVSPLAVRLPVHFTRQDKMARPYLLLDSARAARYLGVPFGRPRPDPNVQDPDTLEIAKEQPHIHTSEEHTSELQPPMR